MERSDDEVTVDQLFEMVKGYTRDAIAPTAKDVIDVRIYIDGILRDQTATDKDLKALAENVGRLWKLSSIDSKRVSELEVDVARLRGLAFFTAGIVIGLLGLGLGAWWLR